MITRWALTGERFVAALAKTLGLVDVILEDRFLELQVDDLVVLL